MNNNPARIDPLPINASGIALSSFQQLFVVILRARTFLGEVLVCFNGMVSQPVSFLSVWMGYFGWNEDHAA